MADGGSPRGAQTDIWEVPEPRLTFNVQLDDGGVIAVRRHGNPSGPRVVLSHGTGLAIDLYAPFWSALLDDFDVFVHDIRNHGWNALGALANHRIPVFVRDHDLVLAAIDGHCGTKPKIGIHHSLAAVVALASLTRKPPEPGLYKALVLFDPPLHMHGVDDDIFFGLAEFSAAKTRRRRSRFATLADFEARVAGTSKFSRVVPGVHNLMARTTLRERADGRGLELRCPPEYEALVFEGIRQWTRSLSFRRIACPIKVIGSDPALPYAYAPSLDDAELAHIEYEFIPGTTHLLQLEAPAKCIAAVRAYLQGLV